MIPYSFSADTVTAFLNGVPYPIDKTHPNWVPIIEGLKAQNVSTEDMLKLVSVRKYVESLKIGAITVAEDAILYNGVSVHNHLTQRMLDVVKQGYDIKPWANFMDRLMKNPSKTAVDELYLWLEQSKMPITEDGHFLAYKKVKDDYTSFHNNKDGSAFNNPLGSWVEMPRNQVDDNRDRTCSTGLHFCSWDYLPNYYGSSGKVLLVKIDPADVVSIPSDYNNAKGRASRYFIFGTVDQEKAKHAFDNLAVYGTVGAGYQSEEDMTLAEWQEAVADGLTELGYSDWLDSQREEPDTSYETWQEQVADGDTDLGFADWVEAQY